MEAELVALLATKLEINDTEKHNLPTAQLRPSLVSLAARNIVVYDTIENDLWELTEEGKSVADNGSHEYIVFEAVKTAGSLSISDLKKVVGDKVAPLGQGTAFKNKWIKKDQDRLIPLVDSVIDTTRNALNEIGTSKQLANATLLNDLKRRKLITKTKQVTFNVKQGPEFSADINLREETDLTEEMIKTGSWKNSTFKKYNFDSQGVPPSGGALHPLAKVRSEFRSIFFEMGFEEMPTNNFVDSCFWNFDALFVPQQHPAREAQDTFYIKDPPLATSLPNKEYVERVRKAHEGGAFGTLGYQYPWKLSETERLVLRTHTTSTSAAMLRKLALDGFKPAKYFSIDRVFRNEQVDATHLAEFHQVEGVIADRGLTLGDLIGFMQQFFAKMGVTNLKFKPAYNPYTEPSMEIFSYHEGLNKLVEIGNSGIFRPEMLEPMGLPPDVRVLGWGLSLERPTMIKYGINNIRSLLGHKNSLEMIEQNAAVRLDKMFA